MPDAGVVHQEVERAEPLGKRVRRGLVGHVQPDKFGLSARLRHERHGFAAASLVHVGHLHAGARRREALCDGPANAGARAGDESRLVREVKHGGTLK